MQLLPADIDRSSGRLQALWEERMDTALEVLGDPSATLVLRDIMSSGRSPEAPAGYGVRFTAQDRNRF